MQRGQPLRAVTKKFGVGVVTVACWVQRAEGQRLDRLDFSDRSRAPHQTRRTKANLENLVLQTRKDLTQSNLGAIGVDAIRQALGDRGGAQVPALRTINRILRRQGALDGKQRTCRPLPSFDQIGYWR